MSKKVSVIIPVYNEAKHLKECVTQVKKTLQNVGVDFEIVISEDGSTDGTDKIAHDLSKKDSAITHLHNDVRLGRGKALKRAFKVTRGDIVIYTDVDLSTDMKYLGDLIREIDNGADIATGSRLLQQSVVKRPLHREMMSRIYNWTLRLMFKSHIHDHQCGFKAFKKANVSDLLDQVEDNHWFWDSELIIKAIKQGFNVVETPVTWVYREQTKVRLATDIKHMTTSTLKLWLQLKKKPMAPKKDHKEKLQ